MLITWNKYTVMRLHCNYPDSFLECIDVMTVLQVQILQGQLSEGVPWRAGTVSHIGTSRGICECRAEWWAIQPEWSVCSCNTDDRCKPNYGSWWHCLSYINNTGQANRWEGQKWRLSVVLKIFLLQILICKYKKPPPHLIKNESKYTISSDTC